MSLQLTSATFHYREIKILNILFMRFMYFNAILETDFFLFLTSFHYGAPVKLADRLKLL